MSLFGPGPYDARQASIFGPMQQSMAQQSSYAPIVDRATFLPIGQDASGSTQWAYPSALMSFLESAKVPGNLLQGAQYTDDQLEAAALDIAPIGAANNFFQPRRVLGSGGSDSVQRGLMDLWDDQSGAVGKSGQQSLLNPEGITAYHGSPHNLPMDEASRMARAQELGFDTSQPLYHGTTHDFPAFGGETHNVEGHFGAGHYFTTDPIDASANYAGLGPDLTNRIELMAERVADDVMDVRNVSQEVAERYGKWVARRQLKGSNEGVIMPVYVRGRTLDVTPSNSTLLDYNMPSPDDFMDEAKATLGSAANEDEIYDLAMELADDAWISAEPSGSLADFITEFRKLGDEYDFDPGPVLATIQENAIDGGISAHELNKILRQDDSARGLMYAEDYDNGGLIGNDIIREAFRRIGFDNIKMDATEAFPHMDNIPPGTAHVIANDPANIRSIFARFDPRKSGSSDVLAGALPFGLLGVALEDEGPR